MNDNNNIECKFVLYGGKHIGSDVHFIKERHKDGDRIYSVFNVLKDYQRPFWITKKHYRTHKQKKESEDITKLDEKKSTQLELLQSIIKELELPKFSNPIKTVAGCPYVYGTDIDARVMIKHDYKSDLRTPYIVATLDLEVDVDTDIVTMGTVTVELDDKLHTYTVVKSNYFKLNTKEEVLEHLKNIPETTLPVTSEVEIVDTELDIIKSLLSKLHIWQPDITAVWNMSYDIGKILKVFEKNNLNPADYFSDPNIPKEYRYFEFKESSSNVTTESGVRKLVKPEERWHVIYTPSSWVWLDAMSCHRYIRVGGKNVPGGYSLDNILNKELGDDFKKLKFPGIGEGLKGADWHRYMLHKHPVLYTVYNIWDALSMQELDRKTNDLRWSIGILAGNSGFDIFNSGPKKIADVLHYFYLSKGYVLGTKQPHDAEQTDNLGLDQWIAILDAFKLKKQSLPVISEGNIENSIRGNTFDLDAVSSYPSNTLVANVSRDTTHSELVSIEGKIKDDFIIHNINLMFGSVNSVSYCNYMLNLPSYEEIDDIVPPKQ